MQDAKGRAERIASGNMVEGDVPQIQDPDKVITGEDEVASQNDSNSTCCSYTYYKSSR